MYYWLALLYSVASLLHNALCMQSGVEHD